MSTALIKRKEEPGLVFEQQAIERIKNSPLYIPRGATSRKDIRKIDKKAFKRYIESEGYGE